jgi:hypothetical protein
MDQYDAIQSQIDILAELLAAGTLNEGQANSFTKKLEHAQDKFLNEQAHTAKNMLGAFINEVEDFAAEGIIDPDTGASMIATAQWIIDNY